MTETANGRRPPNLERLLKERSRADLGEYYSFWDGRAPTPKSSDKLVEILVDRMTDEDSVRKRLKFLSKKLVDLLKFLLRDSAYTVTRETVLKSLLFNYMSQYEVEAALNALQKRGFVFQIGDRTDNDRDDGGHVSFSVPQDLGEVLSAFLWDEECSLADLFSLRGWLRRLGDAETGRMNEALSESRSGEPKLDELVPSLCAPAQIAHRIGGLDEDMQKVLAVAVSAGGGFIPKTLYERTREDAPRWDRRRFKTALEGAYLGTVRHLALGEYGINHFDDTLVLFDDVVSVWRNQIGPDPASEVEDIRTCGVDLISDISNFLSFVAHNRVRLTLNGQIYRTVTKKLTEQLILSKKPEFGSLDPFQYVYDFSVTWKLVERREDRTLHITVKGRKWETEPIEKKLKVLLDLAFKEPLRDGDTFHAPRLRDHLLDLLGTQQVGRFEDVMGAPFAARNLYLARLEEDHIRDAFQNRYQYAPTAVMRDGNGLGQSLFHWMRDRLYLLGMVDLGFSKDLPVATRLTPLGARALGRSLPADLAVAGRPLMVNPDFEVLLFPEEGDTYDLITRLDRFAERQSSDAVYRYKVTEHTIEKAVAEGIDVAEILRVLSENARAAIPQNVVYSIKEWAGKVRFVTARKVTVLKGRNREIMDRVLRSLSAHGVGTERLSPTAIIVEDRVDLKKLAADLAEDGVFLEGGVADDASKAKGTDGAPSLSDNGLNTDTADAEADEEQDQDDGEPED